MTQFSGSLLVWLDLLPRYADDSDIYITVSKTRKGGNHLCNYLLSEIEEGGCSKRNASFYTLYITFSDESLVLTITIRFFAFSLVKQSLWWFPLLFIFDQNKKGTVLNQVTSPQQVTTPTGQK